MKNWIAIVFVSVIITTTATSQSQIKSYVWAQNGLNVRENPGTSEKILESIPFGDSLQILDATDISYNITGISKVDSTQRYYSRTERKAPYIMYGQWIQVLTSSGKVGYVVDHYVAGLRPSEFEGKRFAMISQDTVMKSQDGWEAKYLDRSYQGGVTSSMYINEKGYFEHFDFEGLTIQEAFVIMTCDFHHMEMLVVGQNWESTLSFRDGEMCDFEIVQMDGFVRVSVGCSC